MPRPKLPPRIDDTPAGTYRVIGTVDGSQKFKTVPTRAEAEAIKAQWAGANPLPLVQTAITAAEIRDVEFLATACSHLKLTPRDAAAWLVKYYKPSTAPFLSLASAAFLKNKAGQGRSPGQLRNLTRALGSFQAFVGDKDLAQITVSEVEAWLEDEAGHLSPGSYNHSRNDLHAFFLWCKKRWWIERCPTEPIDERAVRLGAPVALTVEVAIALLRHIEQHHPEWAFFFAIALFAGVRPGVDHGEMRRLNEDLKAGTSVFSSEGILVKGKGRNGQHLERIVAWERCGPLRAWYAAYPPQGNLYPGEDWHAAKFLTGVRDKFSLTHDVMRHTAASAMRASGLSYADIADTLGNSESMLKARYVSLAWTAQDAARLYATLPVRNVSDQVAKAC